MSTNKRFNLMLALIVLVATGLRLYWVIKVGYVPINTGSDQEAYVQQAQQLQNPLDLVHYSYFYVTPGYPMFGGVLLGAQKLLGLDLPPRLIIGVVQVFLAAGSIALTALLARKRTGSSICGLLAASGMSIWISQITAPGSVMAEHLVAPLIMVAIYMVSGSERQPTRPRTMALSTGLLFGTIILIKPIYAPMVLVACGILVVRNLGWRHKIMTVLLVGAGVVMLLAPWAYFVRHQTGHATVSTAFGFNLCLGNNPDADGYWSDEAIQKYCKTANWSNPVRDRQLRDKAIKWMVDNPNEQPRLVRERWKLLFETDWGNLSGYNYPGLWEHWTLPGTPQQWEARNTTQWHWLKLLAPFGLMAMLMSRNQRFAWETLAYAASMLLISMISVADPRYRDPITPLMAIWVAYLLAIVPVLVLDGLRLIVQHYSDQSQPYPSYIPIK